MIDYEKLKKAHELASKRYDETSDSIVIEINICFGCNSSPFVLHLNRCPYGFELLDDLIAKLEELTEKKPKYTYGNTIWYLNADKEIESLEVSFSQFTTHNDWLYQNGKGWSIYEKDCYPTKEDLIDAQWQYWGELRIKSVSASTTCPKCGMRRVANGVCWDKDCDYRVDTDDSTLQSHN